MIIHLDCFGIVWLGRYAFSP